MVKFVQNIRVNSKNEIFLFGMQERDCACEFVGRRKEIWGCYLSEHCQCQGTDWMQLTRIFFPLPSNHVNDH